MAWGVEIIEEMGIFRLNKREDCLPVRERLPCARKAALVLGSSQRKSRNKCELQGAVFGPMRCGLAGLE